jgi:hypothetical protein
MIARSGEPSTTASYRLQPEGRAGVALPFWSQKPNPVRGNPKKSDHQEKEE